MPSFKDFFKLAFAALLALPAAAFSQAQQHDANPNFRAEKVSIPRTLKQKSIIGHLANGRVLVQCASSDGASRDFFWVNAYQTEPVKWETPIEGILEIAALDSAIFFTAKNHGDTAFFQMTIDRNGNILSEQHCVLGGWRGEVLNPHVFRLRTGEFPAMVFAARTNGRKDFDLFVSELRTTGWTRPVRLSNPDINTPSNERQPSVNKDGMLFFTSDRPGETGIPVSKKEKESPTDLWFALPDYHGFWEQAPVNPMPAPFNSAASERSIVVLQKNFRKGFFVSDREYLGRFELYRFQATDTMPTEIPPRYHALLIGVDDYRYMNKLTSPISNNRKLKQVLELQYGFQVDVLENPTGEEILGKLAEYQQLQEHEYLLISFFGHGIKLPRVDGGASKLYCALAGVDGRPNGENCISPEEFLLKLNFIERPRHILFIGDACFSGLFQAMAMKGSEFDDKSRKVLTSTRGSLVPDEGAFFSFLLDGLRKGPAANRETMNAKDLYDYIWKKMGALSNNENEPTYFDLLPGSGGGHFPFPPLRH